MLKPIKVHKEIVIDELIDTALTILVVILGAGLLLSILVEAIW